MKRDLRRRFLLGRRTGELGGERMEDEEWTGEEIEEGNLEGEGNGEGKIRGGKGSRGRTTISDTSAPSSNR